MPQAPRFAGTKKRAGGLLAAAAATAEQVAQSALFAHAVSDRKDDGEPAAVENVVEDSRLRATQDEQKNQDPQAAVPAKAFKTVH